MLIQGHWAYHLAFFIVHFVVVNYETVIKKVDDAECLAWESWANTTNDLMWKIHLYIFLAMILREVTEAYSLSVFSVRVLMLLTIPGYLSQTILCSYSLRGAKKRHDGWIERNNFEGDLTDPC